MVWPVAGADGVLAGAVCCACSVVAVAAGVAGADGVLAGVTAVAGWGADGVATALETLDCGSFIQH